MTYIISLEPKQLNTFKIDNQIYPITAHSNNIEDNAKR